MGTPTFGRPENTEPGITFAAVTPSDSSDHNVRGLYVGTGGNIVVTPYGTGSDVTFKNVASGTVLPIFAKRVKATGTTATDIVGLDVPRPL